MSDQTILVDLDTLLDTRLGTISRISEEAAVTVMNNGYWERERDEFHVMSGGLFTEEQYKELYKARDVETLKAALMTSMLSILGPITKSLQMKQTAKVEVDNIKMIINLYPYTLEKEEVDAIITAIRPYVALNTILSTVSVTKEQLTPGCLNELCDLYVTYEYSDWFGIHRDNLLRTPIPEMSLLVPTIMHNPEVLSEEDLKDSETGQLRDPFKLHQLIMSEVLGIDFQPAFVFSMIH